MDKSELQSLIQQEIQTFMRNGQFNLTKIQQHEHNGVDTVRISESNIIHNNKITVDIVATPVGGIAPVSFPTIPNLNHISFAGILANNAITSYTLTGSLSGGATSATLSSNWNATEVRPVIFSNGDIRYVTFTNSSTAITWTGGLSGTATSSISIGANKRFILNAEAEVGNCYYYNGSKQVFTGNNVIAIENFMYVDSTDLTKNRVGTGSGLSPNQTNYLVYAQDDTTTVIGAMTVTYDYKNVTLDVSTLVSGWKLQGFLIFS